VAGNYSSHISAMIWTAQLILFEHACAGGSGGSSSDEDENSDDDEAGDKVLTSLDGLCWRFMNRRGETAFGHLLQWRLYLSAVAQSAIMRHQARWSLDGSRFALRGITIGISDISRLVASEFLRARRLLEDELLFGAGGGGALPAVASWRLYDDLDDEEYGGSWLTDSRNSRLLEGAQEALLGRIEAQPGLRGGFITTSDDGGSSCFSEGATALYEATVQDFLGSLSVLVHVGALAPLRSPELLSVAVSNSGPRRRNVFIWERLVMLHICYHKS
jgi:hypothetical protein